MNAAGYSKIRSVEPEQVREDVNCGNGIFYTEVVLEVLWLLTDDAIYGVEPRRGETLGQLAERYKVGGYTDDRACFYRAL
jgi:hypothetical protein